MSKVFAGTAMLAVLAGIYFIGRAIVALVRKEPLGVFVKRIFIAAAVVVVASVDSYQAQTPEERAAIQAKREVEAQTDTDKRIAEVEKAPEPVDPPKQPAAEELAEQQRLAEEKRLAEERAAREAERDARRMYVDEINAGFLYGLGINDMGTPRRQMSGQDEILTYPLDKTGELDLVEITTNGKVKSATITIHKFNRDSFVAGVIFYAALIEVFVPPSDANDILGALGLDETIVDTITENRSTVVNHYRFGKSVVNKKIILSVTEQ